MDSDEFKSMSVTLMVAVSISTFILNSACIGIMGKSKALLKRPSTFLILNLLVVHWIQGVLCFPFYAAKKWKVKSPRASQIICDGFRFTYMTTFYGSIFAVLLIAIDRLLATCFVLRYREIVTRKRVIIAIAAVWVYNVAVCSLPFKIHDKKDEPTMKNSTKVNIYQCFYKQSQEWTITMLIINCAIPFFLIIVFYYRILIHIHIIQSRTERARTLTSNSAVVCSTPILRENGSATPQNERVATWREKEQKRYNSITCMCIIMGISYLFFWLPSVIYFVTLRACPNRCFPKGWDKSDEEKLVGFFTKFLAFLDAVSAPIIYCIMSGEFRKHIPCKEQEHKTLIEETRTNYTANYNMKDRVNLL